MSQSNLTIPITCSVYSQHSFPIEADLSIMFRMKRALPFLTLLACTEYNIKERPEPEDGDDTAIDTGTTPIDTGEIIVDACGDFEDPAVSDVDLNAECDVDLSTGSFTPVIEWSYGSSSFCGPPAVGQLVDTNGSGAIDSEDMPIILIYQANNVVALYGDGSGVAWQTRGASYGQDGGFAVGDLDGDGWPEVVTANNTQVCVLEGKSGTERWCKTGLSASLDPYGYSYPAIADMDGVGSPLITVGNLILKADGTQLGRGSYGIGAAPYGGVPGSSYGALSVPIDLDGDGTMELVTGNAAYDNRGNTVWYNGGLDGLVAIADFDGDGQGEIVKTSGIYVYGMETDGTVAWGPKTYSGNRGATARQSSCSRRRTRWSPWSGAARCFGPPPSPTARAPPGRCCSTSRWTATPRCSTPTKARSASSLA